MATTSNSSFQPARPSPEFTSSPCSTGRTTESLQRFQNPTTVYIMASPDAPCHRRAARDPTSPAPAAKPRS
ncbi:hypothetical protein M0R45_005018 [Rubus argutus]|uniref:Uncharacterized protein n=1 Tax=Rubus argutus TaxID=59490 RepID=A0AAW1YLA3_RUBAR